VKRNFETKEQRNIYWYALRAVVLLLLFWTVKSWIVRSII